MSDFNFLSPDSRCWSFDHRANGYARGEGFAILVAKRLSDALKDGDTIRAVIQSTALNQDGKTPGITQPDGQAQLALIRRVYQQVGLEMEPTRYFEAHGTGTAVGDPIEANAIGKAFRHCRHAQDPLYVGSVKANVGHLEGGSGLASLLKTVMILERGIIPPLAGFEQVNHRIDDQGLGIRVRASSQNFDRELSLTVSRNPSSVANFRPSASLCKIPFRPSSEGAKFSLIFSRSTPSGLVAQTQRWYLMMHSIFSRGTKQGAFI